MTYKYGAKVREWTVGELRQMLSHLPQDALIKLEDADTSWTIHKFDDTDSGELWFHPSDYSEMSH